jgi:hypothetical protein
VDDFKTFVGSLYFILEFENKANAIVERGEERVREKGEKEKRISREKAERKI